MAKTRSNKRPAQSGSSGRNAKKIKAEREAGLVEELQQKTEEAENEDKFVEEVIADDRFKKRLSRLLNTRTMSEQTNRGTSAF